MVFLLAWIPMSVKKSSPQAISKTTAENIIKNSTIDLTKQNYRLVNQVIWSRLTRMKTLKKRKISGWQQWQESFSSVCK